MSHFRGMIKITRIITRHGQIKIKYKFMKNKLFVRSLLNSLGVFVYIFAIALFFFNANKLFGAEDNFLMPVLMLLLLVLSATITGALVLGKPIMLFLENQKEAAVKLLGYTIGWLAVFAVIAMIVLVSLK